MKRNIFLPFIVLMGLAIMGCPNPAAETSVDQIITLLAIPGVVAPVRGAVPATTAIDTEQYTGTISWSPASNPFAASTVYTATIVLTAKAGWTLAGVAANSFTVAGATATNAVNSGTVEAVFPATGVPADIDIIFSNVEQAGGTSDSASTTSLILTFSADPTSLMEANISLTGASKGALSGTGTTRSLEISDISVGNGATVSVTVTSPAGYAITGSPQTVVVYKAPSAITLLAISGVVAPVRGAAPATTAIDTEQYTGTISWSPASNPFAASTVYTATIVLTAKAGWTLAGVAANSFTVAGATATNAVNSGTVEAVFPITETIQPSEVENLAASRSDASTIVFSWIEPDDADFDHVVITRSPGSSSEIIYPRGSTSHVFSDMSQSTSYTITIKAVDSAGNHSSGRSLDTVVVILGDITLTLASAIPSGLSLSLSGGQTTLGIGQSMTVLSLPGLSSYDWRLDGVTIGTGPSVTITAASVDVGKHVLVLLGQSEGHLHSSGDLVFMATSNN